VLLLFKTPNLFYLRGVELDFFELSDEC
jgi:hypothetical protein